MAAASSVVEVPTDVQTPQEVASVFQRLQNGSDIRGIAIPGLLAPLTDLQMYHGISVLFWHNPASELMMSISIFTSNCLVELLLPAGVEGEEQNITPTVAFYIGIGFASWLSETLKRPANSLQISVSHSDITTSCKASIALCLKQP